MSHSIDHLGFSVNDYAKAKAFYDKCLAPLGISMLMELAEEKVGGYGRGKKADFWIVQAGSPLKEAKSLAMHICFTANSRKEVDAFYAAALAAGGTDNGKPGLRPEYHEHYYGAFVFDLDGHNIEACYHKPV